MRAIRFAKTGGPEVLELADVPTPAPGEGEVLVRNEAIGVNFIDCYHRSGLYPVPALPSGLGLEACGVVEAVGPGATLSKGERVAYASGPLGAYAELHVVSAARTVPVPRDLPASRVAASLLKGMTAEYLCRRCHEAKPGETALVHAAAGGVGQLLTQWLTALGVTVLATVGSEEKARVAKARGAAHTILYRDEDFVARVRELTGGRGCDVVYDSVGKDTFVRSLDCVRPRGLLVGFGNASGKPDPLDLLVLANKGSLYVTRATLMAYTATRAELELSARSLFEAVERGAVTLDEPRALPLAEASRAHADLEARATTGSTILVP